jgi:hypothetical protein
MKASSALTDSPTKSGWTPPKCFQNTANPICPFFALGVLSNDHLNLL